MLVAAVATTLGGSDGGEDIGAADQPQDLELRVVRHAEAADGADALAERADDEIDVVDHALRLGNAAAILADEAHRMRLVDQHHRAIFLGDADHFLQRRDVAEHRIDALEHDELARFGRQALQPFFQRLDVIVAEGDDFGIAHRAAVIDRRMAVDVEDDIVALARDRRMMPRFA